jgi:pimeloyl-ACP methyl ester carboxylesterase
MDAWHHNGVASQLRKIPVPVLIAAGMEDIVIPASNALKLVNAIPSAWLAQFPHGGHAFMAISTSAGRSNQQFSRSWMNLSFAWEDRSLSTEEGHAPKPFAVKYCDSN